MMTEDKFDINNVDQTDALMGGHSSGGADDGQHGAQTGRRGGPSDRTQVGGGASWNAARANLVLVVLYGAAIGSVYVMSLRCTPPEASAEQSAVQKQVDSELSRLENLSPSDVIEGKRASELVNAFYRSTKGVQVPPAAIGGNPFVFLPPERRQPVPDEQHDAPQKKTAQNTQSSDAAEAMEAAGELVLQSVLTGSHGAMAMISQKSDKTSASNLIGQGQKINGWTVVKIYPNRVVLRWKDRTYILKMSR